MPYNSPYQENKHIHTKYKTHNITLQYTTTSIQLDTTTESAQARNFVLLVSFCHCVGMCVRVYVCECVFCVKCIKSPEAYISCLCVCSVYKNYNV